uniref:MIF4G domain-containing protein n=1 Tax=Glossina morsitans morsitans TaxID=37546 RepID=A0A1B0FIS5_GLOMM
MANVISSNTNNNNNNKNNNCSSNTNEVMPSQVAIATGTSDITNLRELGTFLQTYGNNGPNSCPYDHVIDMIRDLSLQDDGITMNRKIKSIETDFCNIVKDENMLHESMQYINNKALDDDQTALKFALLFASRNFDALAMKETKVRSAMLTILQNNYTNADTYRIHNRDRLYNSITLLGEYYHRVRLADNTPIAILGESLLGLMIREVKEPTNINDVKLVKLILSQISLNGAIMRDRHIVELNQLLFLIRTNLIEHPCLKSKVKAVMLMTLDLYYSNFTSLGDTLEEMYTKYWIMIDDDEGNNNQNHNSSIEAIQSQPPCNSQEQPLDVADQNHTGLDNGVEEENSNIINEENPQECYEDPFSLGTKKWSEHSYGESFLDVSINGDIIENDEHVNNSGDEQQDPTYSCSGYFDDNDLERQNRNSRRSYQPYQSPRPLKDNFHDNISEYHHHYQEHDTQANGTEERDETKPLPRWRTTRFNRNDQSKDGRCHQRRFSASFEDDRNSVHSEGGSIRLYSINDRLRHAQEKIERGNNSQYSSLANSNWDRQSRDDRSERSYQSNYERGNQRRGARSYNNRSNYDKPPRFQKQKHNHNNEKRIVSESWRRSNNANNFANDSSSYNANDHDVKERNFSRAQTLPRPAKSRIDGVNHSNAGNYRRSQSPVGYERNSNHSNHQGKMRSHNFNNQRYSSQSSLTSETSGCQPSQQQQQQQQHHHQRNRSFKRRSQPPPQTYNHEEDWNCEDAKGTSDELVRNAQQTTKYMNYLSSKK